jgi:hypothetical protein
MVVYLYYLGFDQRIQNQNSRNILVQLTYHFVLLPHFAFSQNENSELDGLILNGDQKQ